MLLQVCDSPETTGIGIIQPDETKTYIKKQEKVQGFLMDKLQSYQRPPGRELTKLPSCPDKSESLGFPLNGMKFDVVIQWVIA